MGTMSAFSIVAAEVQAKILGLPQARRTAASVGKEVALAMSRRVAEEAAPAPAQPQQAPAQPQQAQKPAQERDAEWQRVNSYIADVLKDAHVLYSKLARLQGDFIGEEQQQLEEISEKVLDIGGSLSEFMKQFHSGELNMLKESTFGHPGTGAPPGTPPPAIPAEFASPPKPEAEFEAEINLVGEDDFAEYDEEEEKKSEKDE